MTCSITRTTISELSMESGDAGGGLAIRNLQVQLEVEKYRCVLTNASKGRRERGRIRGQMQMLKIMRIGLGARSRITSGSRTGRKPSQELTVRRVLFLKGQNNVGFVLNVRMITEGEFATH